MIVLIRICNATGRNPPSGHCFNGLFYDRGFHKSTQRCESPVFQTNNLNFAEIKISHEEKKKKILIEWLVLNRRSSCEGITAMHMVSGGWVTGFFRRTHGTMRFISPKYTFGKVHHPPGVAHPLAGKNHDMYDAFSRMTDPGL